MNEDKTTVAKADLEKQLVGNAKRFASLQGTIKQQEATLASVRQQDALKQQEIDGLKKAVAKRHSQKKNSITIRGEQYQVNSDVLIRVFDMMSRNFHGRHPGTQAVPLLAELLGIDSKEAQKLLA